MPAIVQVQGSFLSRWEMPARRDAHACCICCACGPEVAVSAAPAGAALAGLRRTIRERLDVDAAVVPALDEFVNAAARCWPHAYMTILARRQPESQEKAVEAVKVIVAKTREDVEAMWGAPQLLVDAFDRLGMPVVVELANLWFESPENRDAIRQACREARST